MTKIVTTAQAQREIGKISQSIGENIFIVTSHGVGRMVVLPYFDGCDESLADYMEQYEMMQNQENLKKRYKKSSDSGESNLIV